MITAMHPRILFLLLWPIALSACGSAQPRQTQVSTLPPVQELGKDFFWRQRIEAHHPKQTVSFNAVIQKRGQELTLLGLTPFGTRAFVLKQKNKHVSFQSFIQHTLPFPPENILRDVYRVFRVSQPHVQGWYCHASVTERICNLWQAQRLIERRYQSLDTAKGAPIVIRYEGGFVSNTPPRNVILQNPQFGYTLRITTLPN